MSLQKTNGCPVSLQFEDEQLKQSIDFNNWHSHDSQINNGAYIKGQHNCIFMFSLFYTSPTKPGFPPHIHTGVPSVVPSIHPSSSALSRARSHGQLPEQGHPDFPLPGHFLQLFRGDPKAFPGQLSNKVTPACPGSSSGSPHGGTCQEHLLREASQGHPKQMPKPPQLAPLDVEGQRLYSELLSGDRAPHPNSAEETHFGHLYPGSYSLGHDPKFIAIGEGPQNTCGLVGQTPMNPQAPCGGYRAGPVFHGQDENCIVSPGSTIGRILLSSTLE